MADSIPLVIEDDAKKSARPAFLMMLLQGVCNIQYKALLFLLIIFIFVTSDVFNNLLLNKIQGTLDGGVVTPYGVILQGLTLVVCYMIVQFLVDQKII